MKTEEGLKRVMGVPGLSMNIINGTIGAGIFALPAIISIALGAFGIFSYLFCGIMMAAIMLCYAEIGTRITTSGGSYAYVEAAFGSFAGFIINWLFFFGFGILGDAAVINIVADSLAVIFPVFQNLWVRGLLFFILIGFMVLINVRGVKHGVGFVKLITIIKLLPLIAIIIFGFSHIKTTNLHWENLPSFNTFGNTTLVLFFAFMGFETALNASGEIKNPKRTVPLGILAGGLLVLIVYLLLQTVTQGILGTHMETVRGAPLAAVAEKIIGPVGGIILLIAAAISCFGNVSGDVLLMPRLLFAGANDGIFPKFLGKTHPKFATPYWAIIIYGSLILIFSVSGGFKQLAILASAAILIIYFAVILATIKLRKKEGNVGEKTFRTPGGLIIPFIGIAAIVWLLTSLGKWEIGSTIIFIACVSTIYLFMKKYQKRKIILPEIKENEVLEAD
ncbi:MAG TPA: amino acid permease [Hanamia sp.]|nr:amino acid permease [Hanamia sp.]